MSKYVLSIDPGWSTGVAFLAVSGEVVTLEGVWQFTSGVDGLLNWMDKDAPSLWDYPDHSIIVEKFTPHPNEKFGLTLRAVEPLVCEGALIANGYINPYEPGLKEWRQPKDQYIVGGKDLVDKKKRQHAFLKDSDFYVTNKMFPDSPTKDQADDARSAIAHALGYLSRVKKHRGALAMMSGWSEDNG